MSRKDIAGKLQELKALRAQAADLDKAIEGIEGELKQEMTRRKVDELAVGEYKVRWLTVKSSRFDSVACKAAYADLHRVFTRETETRRFIVA